MTDVTYYFDPACPWTWYTTKWLRQVEISQKLNIHWRSFSLLVLNGPNVPEKYLEALTASHASLRMVEALNKDGQPAKIIQFHEWFSSRVYEHGVPCNLDLVREAIEANGLHDYAAAIEDESLDALVEESTQAGIAAAGPDIGSPVIVLDGIERGFHGPVLEMVDLDPATSDRIWDVVNAALRTPQFYEIKRGRNQ